MRRPVPLAAATLAALLPFLTRCAPQPPGETVVVVLLDTFRRDALGCYGAPERATPCLDALARECVTFRDAVSPSGWTLPSAASLLTGVWPTVHGGLGKDVDLTAIRAEVPLAAELFGAAGYRTTGIANAAFVSPLLGFGRGFDEYDHQHAFNSQVRRADESVDLAIRALAAARGERHFLFLHLFDAHLDYDPLPGWDRAFLPAGAPPGRLTASDCEELGREGGLHPGSPEALRVRGTYLGEVAAVDRAVGRLVGALRRAGLWERCTFVVTADHGEEMWEHGGFEHGHTLHEELVRIPLLMRVPGAAGRTEGGRVRIVDVLPTLCEAAGIPAPPAIAGESLLSRMRGGPAADRPAFYEGTLYGDNRIAWSQDGWKLIWDLDAEPETALEIFDLETDPGELRNLAAERPDRAGELGGALRSHVREITARARELPPAEPVRLHPQDVEALRSLGYVR
jgi:arylsulfatase A-like enzyme